MNINTTDDTRPWYGKMEGVHPRAKKKIFTEAKSHMDGEDAWQTITIGSIEQRKAFVDQLPMVICVEGLAGLEEKFSEWLAEERKNGFKKK